MQQNNNKPVLQPALLNEVLTVLFQRLKLDNHIVRHRARFAPTAIQKYVKGTSKETKSSNEIGIIDAALVDSIKNTLSKE